MLPHVSVTTCVPRRQLYFVPLGMQEDMHRFRQFSSFDTKLALVAPAAQCVARPGSSPCSPSSGDSLAEAAALSSISVRLNTLEVTAASLRPAAADIVQHVVQGETGSGIGGSLQENDYITQSHINGTLTNHPRSASVLSVTSTVGSPTLASQAAQRLMCLAERGLQLNHCLTTSIHAAECPGTSLF